MSTQEGSKRTRIISKLLLLSTIIIAFYQNFAIYKMKTNLNPSFNSISSSSEIFDEDIFQILAQKEEFQHFSKTRKNYNVHLESVANNQTNELEMDPTNNFIVRIQKELELEFQKD